MDIPAIKAHLSLLQVLAHYGLQPDRNNRLCCPFHPDKTPSLQIYPKTDTYCCFSTNCSAGSGDQIQFIELMEKQGKHQAILKAKALIGEVAPVHTPQPEPVVLPVEPVTGQALSRIAVLSKFYEGSLHRNETAVKYLSSRGLPGTEAGYVSEKMGLTWNEKLRQNGIALGLLLQKADGTLSPRFKGCIVFALKNKQGQTVSIYGRSVSDHKDSRHYYLPGGHQGLYPSYPSLESQVLILTESVIDAASLLEAGVSYPVVALYGTNGFTQEHETLIRELTGLREVILFFDGDDAGRKAVEKLAPALLAIKPALQVSHIVTPEGEDCNSLLQSHEKAVFAHLLDSRLPVEGVLFLSTEKALPKNPVLESLPLEPTKPVIPLAGKASAPASKLNASNPQLVTFSDEALHITILGGIKMSGLDRLRVTLKLELPAQKKAPIRHSLDLYHADALEKLLQKVSEDFSLAYSSVQVVFGELIDSLEQYRLAYLEKITYKAPEKPVITPQQAEKALRYLKSPDLMPRTLEDLGKTGIVGEDTNRAVMFFVFLSRLLSEPLHVVSMGASGTGKTYLQERVAALVPQECKLEVTTLSENALYYFGQQELAHKLLLIEDLDGAQEVLYPLRELQSKQKITKTVSLKDSKGNIKTVTFTVEGPVCIAGCTTKEKLYEDNENRALVLHVDGSIEQDERIMGYQRKKAAGLVDTREETEKRELFQTIHRLLKPIRVVNPYAHRLIIPDTVFKKRRSNSLYLKFIEVVTLFHQCQREKKADLFEGHYIETTLQDIAWANQLLKPILLAKSDELSGASRRFLESLKAYLQQHKQTSFYAKDIRRALRLNVNNLKRYLIELTRNGYVQISAGSKAKGYQYQIVNYQEYQQLQHQVHTVLDDLLEKLRAEEAAKNQAGKGKSKAA